MPLISQREQQVIHHAALGHTAKQTARLTGLEHRTVEFYLSSSKKKLKAKNIGQAVYKATTLGLLPPAH